MCLFRVYPVEPFLDDEAFIIYFYKEEKDNGKRNRTIINEITENFCYDRDFCEKYNIDYCEITGKDILNIRRHIIRVLKEHGLI